MIKVCIKLATLWINQYPRIYQVLQKDLEHMYQNQGPQARCESLKGPNIRPV